jgi:hypothetical protein
MISDLNRKKERIMELHGLIFDPGFWSKFTSIGKPTRSQRRSKITGNFYNKRGEPISLSVLGLNDFPDTRLMHPLLIVINNRLEQLWSVDSIISDALDNPEAGIN